MKGETKGKTGIISHIIGQNKGIAKTTLLSRRDFIKVSSLAGMATLLGGSGRIFAAGSDKIRVGLIGCGNRGVYDTVNCLNSSPGVELVAMGDLFKDHLDKALAKLKQKLPEKVKVTKDACFVGFDAYKKVLACDIDLVMLTETPHFRPEHFKAAIEAGKHVFMEKPVAVDPVGVRSIIATSELADRKGLTVVAGTQMRRIAHIVEIMKRIHNGDIGEIVGGQCCRMGSGLLNWGPLRQPGWSDMEWQIRNWYFYTWLSGDFIVEQHVHNLDIMNWAIGSHPIKCIGLGGRQVRTGPKYGNIFDHFAVEYEYPNGALKEEHI